MLKNNHWQPTASLSTLRARANIIARIREFFSTKDILEVETPLLAQATVTDPYVNGIKAAQHFLQTSPEYAMKRLLAAGSGSIYQICKAFRNNDISNKHNPEFTMLEWYHVGFDHHDLMDEMDELLQFILKSAPAIRQSCSKLYKHYLGINPHSATINELAAIASHINFAGELTDKNAYLELLFTHLIEPHIGQDAPLFLYDFPVSQAALSQIRVEENPPVASRFEVYYKGFELANGFHELQNVTEQRLRFENDIIYRQNNDLASVAIDENFLAALEAGLPNCAGVALGVDRLIMIATLKTSIEDVVAFPWRIA